MSKQTDTDFKLTQEIAKHSLDPCAPYYAGTVSKMIANHREAATADLQAQVDEALYLLQRCVYVIRNEIDEDIIIGVNDVAGAVELSEQFLTKHNKG